MIKIRYKYWTTDSPSDWYTIESPDRADIVLESKSDNIPNDTTYYDITVEIVSYSINSETLEETQGPGILSTKSFLSWNENNTIEDRLKYNISNDKSIVTLTGIPYMTYTGYITYMPINGTETKTVERFEDLPEEYDSIINFVANPFTPFDLGGTQFSDLGNPEFKELYNDMYPQLPKNKDFGTEAESNLKRYHWIVSSTDADNEVFICINFPINNHTDWSYRQNQLINAIQKGNY